MVSTLARLIDQHNALLDQIDALTDSKGGRGAALADSTTARTLHAMEKQAGALKVLIAAEEDKPSLGAYIPAFDGDNPTFHAPPTGAPTKPTLIGTSWGAAVLTKLGDPRHLRAALMAPGVVPVSVPLSPAPVTEGKRTDFLRSLLPNREAPGGAFAYLRQTVRTNAAAPVPKGERKPTSTYTVERIDDRTRTVAHLTEPVNRADISDAVMLAQFLDSELRYGVELGVDALILDGDTDTNPQAQEGVLDAATGAQSFATDALTTARKAITKLQAIDLAPTGFAFSPADWETIELEALATFAANPNMSPVEPMTRRLFGIPVVVTTALDDGQGIVGDWLGSAELFVTEEASVSWSEGVYDKTFDGDTGATDFERNLIRFRGEGRFGIAVTRPAGFVVINFGS